MKQSWVLVRRLILDVALWYIVPAAFIATYVVLFSEPTTAVFPHLLAVALPLLLVILARLALSRFVSSIVFNRALASILIAAVLTLLILYYALVLIGLSSWGGIISWEVIITVFRQTQVAADLLQVPNTLVLLAPWILLLALTFISWVYLNRFDWTIAWVRKLSTPTISSVLAGGMTALAIFFFEFSFGYATHVEEPISMTIFPPREALALEGYTVNPVTASRIDRETNNIRNAYEPASSAERKNFILIVVDALRPDHMSAYGYGRDTTPNISRITREISSRIVGGTHASCGDTACAMFSLFSSKFPSEYSFRPFFLHEALRRNGYRIHLILSGDHTNFFSLKRFYGNVDSFYDGNENSSNSLNDDKQVLDQVAKMPDWDGGPAMLQFHLMSAHILRSTQQKPGPFIPAARYGITISHDTGPGGVPSQAAVNFYDNGVLQADSVTDSILAALKEKGYLRNTLVVITADHGEALGEHGLFKHANSVREELLRVPLIFLFYGYQSDMPTRPRDYPSQVDIAPTILAELGLPIPGAWVGTPLQLMNTPRFSFFEENAFAGVIDHQNPSHVLKYWVDSNEGDDHVFDLNADPHEDHDLRDALPRSRLTELRKLTRTEVASSLKIH